MKMLLAAICLLLLTFQANGHFNDDKSLFIVGSTSMAKLIDLTRKPFFDKTGINILIRPIGSEKGVVSIAEGLSDIGIISRYMTAHEVEKWPFLSQITVGQDAIVFFTHSSNSISNLTTEQIVNIYTGKKPYWDEKNQQDIILLSKGQRHGTHDAFLNYFQLESMPAPMKKNELVFKKRGINQLFSNHTVKTFNRIHQAVGNVTRLPNALTYESLGAYLYFRSQQSSKNVKLISLNNQEPLIDGKINQNYQFKRPLNIIVGDNASEDAKLYIEFLLSDDTQKLLSKSFFPINQ